MARPRIHVNLSIPERARDAVQLGAEGVGLMRAEFLVYQTGRHPMFLLTEQAPNDLTTVLGDGMRTVAREFGSAPVLYRSMDLRSSELRNLIGGAEYEEREDNPALGCRGMNRAQRDPDTFRAELAAIAAVRGEGYTNVHLLLPFVRWPEEVEWARKELEAHGLGGDSGPEVWMMVETPAVISRAADFAGLVDGVSVGSNDLAQLVLGLDRDNAAFARQDWDLDPAVVTAIRNAVDAYRALDIPVSICGDGPSRSDELLAMVLEWGLSSISVSLDRLEPLKERLDRPAMAGVAE
jgi:pyruvate,water dikinase